MTNESLPTKSQETTESVTINNKTNPQPSTESPPSTTNTEAPNHAKQHWKGYTSGLILKMRPWTTLPKWPQED